MLDRNLMLESDSDRDTADAAEEGFDDITVLGASAGDDIPEDRQPSSADRDLRARLMEQVAVAFADPTDLQIALSVLDALDETG
jgi:DNA-directed RNA polymerase specialized sigma54-like protein